MKKAFCFRVDKSLNMAYDNETGESCEAFIKATLNIENPPSDPNRKEAHEGVRRMIASQMGVDPNLIYPMTEEEYNNETGEE
jgi:hypothetical protein